MTHSLKTILSVVGIAAMVASPAFAKTRNHVQAQAQTQVEQPAAAPSTTVVAPNGRVIGTDPDINVRSELLRDYPTSEGAN